MRTTFTSIAFAAAAAAFAVPASAATFSLGNLSAVSPVSQTRSFSVLSGSTSFTDYYTFSITSQSTVSGTTTERDGYVSLLWSMKTIDVEVGSLALSKLNSNGTYSSLVADSTPEAFSFTSLQGGSYRLTLNGTLATGYSSGSLLSYKTPSYTLTASATASPVAAPVPEASDLAMTAIGLGGVAFWARRRRQA